MKQMMASTTRSPDLAALLAAYGPRVTSRALAEAVTDECGCGALEREPWITWHAADVTRGPGEDEDEGEDDIDTGPRTHVRHEPASPGRCRTR